MKLHEVLKEIVDDFGADKYYDDNIINYISDYSSEAFQPTSLKKIFKYVVEDEYPIKISESADYDNIEHTLLMISKFTSEIVNNAGFSKSLTTYVLKSIAYSIGYIDVMDIEEQVMDDDMSRNKEKDKGGVSWFGPSPQDKAHLHFKGVRIYGNSHTFVEKMIEAGYVLNKKESNEQNIMLVGSYANIPSKLMVQISPKTHRTSRVMVIFDDKIYKNWPSLKALYYNLKDQLTKKYGEPFASTEAFFPPYKEGCGKEIKLLDANLGAYQSKYDADGGEVRLVIMSEARVIIAFMDTQGCIELNREFEESIQNDM